MTSRLTNSQIIIVRALATRGAAARAITLARWQWRPALPLVHRGLVEIWYRQTPGTDRALQGPFYGLSVDGAKLAANFLSAPSSSSVRRKSLNRGRAACSRTTTTRP